MKWYSTLRKAPRLESHHQIQFRIIFRTLLGNLTPLHRCSRRIQQRPHRQLTELSTVGLSQHHTKYSFLLLQFFFSSLFSTGVLQGDEVSNLPFSYLTPGIFSLRFSFRLCRPSLVNLVSWNSNQPITLMSSSVRTPDRQRETYNKIPWSLVIHCQSIKLIVLSFVFESFPSFRLVALLKTREHNLSYYLPIAGWKKRWIDDFFNGIRTKVKHKQPNSEFSLGWNSVNHLQFSL